MKVLIVDNEMYLAGSIATKLADLGYECDIASSIKEALRAEDPSFVLLSTNINGQDFYPVIEKFKSSIIILLISYISNDTVIKPIKAGASDYIQKPFMIEELIRKMNDFERFKRISKMLDLYKDYTNSFLKDYDLPNIDFKKIKLPILLKSKKIQSADKFMFHYADEMNSVFNNIKLKENENLDLKNLNLNNYTYISNIQFLKPDVIEQLFSLCYKKRVILASTNLEQECPFENIELKFSKPIFNIDEILSIDEYIQQAIYKYQEIYPDTELSKKLGISRKSLWEKRKKYDIIKKK